MVPILVIGFNRPNKIRQLVNRLNEIDVDTVYISLDGPRHNDDKIKIEEIKKILAHELKSKEKVYRFAEKNLGCKGGVTAAINWFFDNVDEGIILEDDCLPSNNFIEFSTILLEKFRNDDSVMHISGYNHFPDRIDNSIYFSRFPGIWGWACWKRAWKKNITDANKLLDRLAHNKDNIDWFPREYKFWKKKMSKVKSLDLNTWDYNWALSIRLSGGFSIRPSKNLIQNIGFDDEGTHTTFNSNRISSNLPDLNYSIDKLPEKIEFNTEEDLLFYNRQLNKTIFRKIEDRILNN